MFIIIFFNTKAEDWFEKKGIVKKRGIVYLFLKIK
jgi:hypothetical protein